jgi:hypothetical protein
VGFRTERTIGTLSGKPGGTSEAAEKLVEILGATEAKNMVLSLLLRQGVGQNSAARTPNEW